MLRIATVCLLALSATTAAAQFLDNGVVRVGVDLARGGAISYLSESGSTRNVVNVRDLGRYVQQSYYSGPDPFVPDGAVQHPAYPGWGWNPVQAGDVYGYPSTLVDFSVEADTLYVKSVPRQWALNGVDTAATSETWVHLDENRVHLRCRLVNARPDTTRYPARNQELPAVYTIGELHRLFTYTGDAPFTGDTLTQIVNSGPPWEYWSSTENWSALVDDEGWGLGVFHPGAQLTVGGFSGVPGTGGPYQTPTGYVSPLHTDVIDHDIVYEYEATLILGTLEEIRAHAVANRAPVGPRLDFARDRQHCFGRNLTDDAPPYDGRWTLHLDVADPQVMLPPGHWNASDVPLLEIVAAHRTTDDRAELYFAGPGESFSGTRRLEIPVVPDGTVRTYRIDLSAHPEYTGVVSKLRFDPVVQAQPGDEVDLIALRVPEATDAAPAPRSTAALSIESVHPNPFNPLTTVRWRVKHATTVDVEVLDAAGRRVATLATGRDVTAGAHTTRWDGRDDGGMAVASGVYHVRVSTPAATRTSRVVLVR